MVFRIVDITVVREHDPLGSAGLFPYGIYIAFVISDALPVRKIAFIVSELVSSDGLAGSIRLEGSSLPAESPGFLLGYVVRRKMPVEMYIESNFIPG